MTEGRSRFASFAGTEWFVLLVVVLSAPPASPATKTWTGGAGAAMPFWSMPANWSPTAIPVSGDDLVFPAAAQLSNVNTISGLTLSSISITTAGYSISGAGITLGTTGITAGPGGNQITLPISVSGATTVDVGLSGVLALTGVVSGAGGLSKQGAGGLVLSGANTYAGTTSVGAGFVQVNADAGLGSTSGSTTVTIGATLQVGSGLTIAEPLTLSGSGVAGAGALFLGSGATGLSGVITLASSTTVTASAGATLTLQGAVNGGGALTKTGPGTLALSGTLANNFSGTTTVNDGTLTLGKPAGTRALLGDLVVGDGSGVDMVQFLSDNQLSLPAVTVVGPGVLDLNGHSDLVQSLTMTGGSVLTGTGVLGLTQTLTTNASASVATLSGNVSLSGAMRPFAIADGAASPDLSITAAISNGGISKSGLGTLAFEGTAPNTYTGTTSVGGGVLTLGKSPGTTAVAGPLAVGNSTAPTDTVLLLADGQIADGVAVSTNSTGLFDLNGHAETIGSLSMVGGDVATGAGTLTLGGDVSGPGTISGQLSLGGSVRTFTVSAGTLSIPAVVSSGGLVKAGSGTLSLSNANVYAGATTVTGGTLLTLHDGALGPVATGTTVLAGGTLQLSGGRSIAEPLTLSGGGAGGLGALDSASGTNTVTVGVTLNGDAAIGVDAGQLSIPAALADAGAPGTLTKTGAGTLVLSGTNLYAGPTSVAAGTLSVESNAALGSSSAGTTVSSGATLQLAGGRTIAEPLTLSGSGLPFTAALFSLSGMNAVNATISLNGAAKISGNTDLVLSGAIVDTGAPGTFTVAGLPHFAGPSSNTYAGLTNVVAGILSLEKTSGAFAIPGTLAVTDATVMLAASNQIAATASVFLTRSGLELGDHAQHLSFVQLVSSSVTTNAAGLLTLDGSADMTNSGFGGRLFLPAGDHSLACRATESILATVSGPGRLIASRLNFLSPVALSFLGSAPNTFSGGMSVSNTLEVDLLKAGAIPSDLDIVSGEVLYEVDHAIADGVAVTVEDGCLLDLQGHSDVVGSLTLKGGTVATGAGTLTLGGDVTSLASPLGATVSGNLSLGGTTRTFQIADGAPNADVTVSAAVVNGGVLKAGAGRLVLAGTNAYAGATTVGAGTLLVNGATLASAATISGGIFGGIGAAGAVTATGGAVSPGQSPGILSSGNLILNAASTFTVELDGPTPGTNYDQLAVTGTVSLGDAMLAVSVGFVPTTGQTFTILNNDGSDAISGVFGGLPEGATFVVGGTASFQVTYAGGDGNDVVLTTVPCVSDATAPAVTPPAAATATQTLCQ